MWWRLWSASWMRKQHGISEQLGTLHFHKVIISHIFFNLSHIGHIGPRPQVIHRFCCTGAVIGRILNTYMIIHEPIHWGTWIHPLIQNLQAPSGGGSKMKLRFLKDDCQELRMNFPLGAVGMNSSVLHFLVIQCQRSLAALWLSNCVP